MTILQVPITIAASETPMTFLLAKQEDDGKEKLQNLAWAGSRSFLLVEETHHWILTADLFWKEYLSLS